MFPRGFVEFFAELRTGRRKLKATRLEWVRLCKSISMYPREISLTVILMMKKRKLKVHLCFRIKPGLILCGLGQGVGRNLDLKKVTKLIETENALNLPLNSSRNTIKLLLSL